MNGSIPKMLGNWSSGIFLVRLSLSVWSRRSRCLPWEPCSPIFMKPSGKGWSGLRKYILSMQSSIWCSISIPGATWNWFRQCGPGRNAERCSGCSTKPKLRWASGCCAASLRNRFWIRQPSTNALTRWMSFTRIPFCAVICPSCLAVSLILSV